MVVQSSIGPDIKSVLNSTPIHATGFCKVRLCVTATRPFLWLTLINKNYTYMYIKDCDPVVSLSKGEGSGPLDPPSQGSNTKSSHCGGQNIQPQAS